MNIGLISDIHATPGPLREALELFAGEGVGTILCAGDVAGYGDELEPSVALLVESGCRAILGNHDCWWLERAGVDRSGPTADYLRALPMVVELFAAGKKLHMVHASPPGSLMAGIHLLDESGQLIAAQQAHWSSLLNDLPCDVLVVGHTHQVFVEQLGSVLVINPGSTLFNHSCAILSLPAMEVRILPLSGRPAPLPSWNWGMGFPATGSSQGGVQRNAPALQHRG